MTDREKVIKGLEYGINDDMDSQSCPYYEDSRIDIGFMREVPVNLLRDALALLKAQDPIETRLNLCDSCAKLYPECDATADAIKFGCGVGNDNVIGCMAYVNRGKAQQPRVTREEAECVSNQDWSGAQGNDSEQIKEQAERSYWGIFG